MMIQEGSGLEQTFYSMAILLTCLYTTAIRNNKENNVLLEVKNQRKYDLRHT
jgi:hypothetical protein